MAEECPEAGEDKDQNLNHGHDGGPDIEANIAANTTQEVSKVLRSYLCFINIWFAVWKYSLFWRFSTAWIFPLIRADIHKFILSSNVVELFIPGPVFRILTRIWCHLFKHIFETESVNSNGAIHNPQLHCTCVYRQRGGTRCTHVQTGCISAPVTKILGFC